jgi:chemotaxis protein MotA
LDFATLIGLVSGLGLVAAAITDGGNMGIFVNAPSMMIVGGGTAAVLLMKFPMGEVFNSFRVLKNAFFHKATSPVEIIGQLLEMAMLARKEGVLALESVEPDDPFLRAGIQKVVDGVETIQIKRGMNEELDQLVARHDVGISFFKMGGDIAPAFGMIGTLIGLVQMLSAMEDPSAIGPAMAIALLTTLYGALFANVFFLPISDKLAFRSEQELFLRRLMVAGILAIGRGETNPNQLRTMLSASLAPKEREQLE